MAIRDWPCDERPREKLLLHGAGRLSDAELLAIVLRSGTPGRSALAIARELLRRHGSVRALLAADKAAFCALPGLGNASFAQLQASLELARRHLATSLPRGHALTSPAHARDYLAARMRDHPHEVFACLWLDTRHRVIAFEELFRGTINGASVYPREVVRNALKHNAAAVILTHNHPSGVAEPSPADHSITERLREALGLVDIRVLDHVVVGDGESVSFAERGYL